MGKFLSHSSVRHHGCSMVADAGGVGGEAWTCDGQTNGIKFIPFVFPSPWLRDGTIASGAIEPHSSRHFWTTA